MAGGRAGPRKGEHGKPTREQGDEQGLIDYKYFVHRQIASLVKSVRGRHSGTRLGGFGVCKAIETGGPLLAVFGNRVPHTGTTGSHWDGWDLTPLHCCKDF